MFSNPFGGVLAITAAYLLLVLADLHKKSAALRYGVIAVITALKGKFCLHDYSSEGVFESSSSVVADVDSWVKGMPKIWVMSLVFCPLGPVSVPALTIIM